VRRKAARILPKMRVRLYLLIGTLLLVILPAQGIAFAGMVTCAPAVATGVLAGRDAHPAAGTPCHETPVSGGQGAEYATPADLGGWNSCGGCVQCHACSAGVLPVAVQDTLIAPPLHPAFAPPAAIAGVVLEHIEPPPLG
jgi:hypothetical protein